MLQDSLRKQGIPVFVWSRSSLKVSHAFGNPASHYSLYTSLEKESKAPEQREHRLLRRLLEVLATRISSMLVFIQCFPGDLAGRVQRSIKAYFSEPSEGKPNSCSLKH
jgi:hypothetical protein